MKQEIMFEIESGAFTIQVWETADEFVYVVTLEAFGQRISERCVEHSYNLDAAIEDMVDVAVSDLQRLTKTNMQRLKEAVDSMK